MMRRKLVMLSLCFSVLALGGAAHAGEKPPIEGKAPPKPPPEKEAAKPVAKKPYDLGKLDKVDAATSSAIDILAKSCLMSELSREGPSKQETAKCNAAVSRVAAQGKKGASAILAALNRPDFPPARYGRERLYGVLAKLDDQTVRGVIIEGLATVASEQLTEHASYTHQVDRTLRGMAGGGPAAEIPWEPKPVRDKLAVTAERAAAWRVFQEANDGKTRAQITEETLKAARADKKSDDPKKAFRAIEALLQHAPKEALGAVKAYRKRSDLPKAVSDAFEAMESRITFQIEGLATPKAGS